jgi:hypothetical protein
LPFSIKAAVHRKRVSYGVLVMMTVLSLIVGGYTAFMWFINFPIGFMMFDDTKSLYNPRVWMLFVSTITAPPVCLFSLGFAWMFYTSERYAVACYVALIPWINILLSNSRSCLENPMQS